MTNQPLLFTGEQRTSLFSAILVHDDCYLDAKLPEKIHFNYSQEQISKCYQICLELWQQGVKRKSLRRLIRKYFKFRSVKSECKHDFKNMRAKFKHLRFAHATFTKEHSYPWTFHIMVSLMGLLQDASKNHQRNVVKFASASILMFLSKLCYKTMAKRLKSFSPSTPKSLQDYTIKKMLFIQINLNRNKITARGFHRMRVIISQQVALYDNLKTLYPSDYHSSISKYLSTLNGMMGSLHDELVIKKYNKTFDYNNDYFAIPNEIRERLTNYVNKFGLTDNLVLV